MKLPTKNKVRKVFDPKVDRANGKGVSLKVSPVKKPQDPKSVP